jgi:hypothetical protein
LICFIIWSQLQSLSCSFGSITYCQRFHFKSMVHIMEGLTIVFTGPAVGTHVPRRGASSRWPVAGAAVRRSNRRHFPDGSVRTLGRRGRRCNRHLLLVGERHGESMFSAWVLDGCLRDKRVKTEASSSLLFFFPMSNCSRKQ